AAARGAPVHLRALRHGQNGAGLARRHGGLRMDREAIIRNRDTYDTWHFAEANRVGRTIWVSAQRGFDERDQIARDPVIQARVAFRQLERILREAGATMDDIVSLTSYHTDMAH